MLTTCPYCIVLSQISLEPLFVSMSSSFVFAANKDFFFVWNARTAKTWSSVEATATAGRSGGSRRPEQVRNRV